MAITIEGARLTEAHRQAQVAVQAGFVSEFLAAWGLLDLADLSFSTPNWLRVVMRLIEAFRQDSADLALRYAQDYRDVEVPGADVALPELSFDRGPGPQVTLDLPVGATRVPQRRPGRPAERIPIRTVGPRTTGRKTGLVINWRDRDAPVEATLRTTGPHTIKYRIGRGQSPEQAGRAALVEASGAARRIVGDGGRDTLLTVVRHDRLALGWVRVTDGDPCAFCAMLASRGPVYKTGSFAESDPRFVGPGPVKVHDHCGCTVAPVFSREDALPGRSREFQRLWNDHIQGKYDFESRPGRQSDAERAWRRVYEAQRKAERQSRQAA